MGQNSINKTTFLKLLELSQPIISLKVYFWRLMEIIDSFIIADLQRGSHSAFEKVFNFYFIKVKTFLIGFLKSPTDAEEISEELFMELWENHKNINPKKSFDSYLFTIARNKAINFLKKKYRTQEILEEIDSQPSSHSPEEEYIAVEKSLLIEMIVEKMPTQRKIIYKLRQQGLSNDEISKELGTTKRNVESQISIALKQVRAAFNYYIIFFI